MIESKLGEREALGECWRMVKTHSPIESLEEVDRSAGGVLKKSREAEFF